MTLTVLAVIAGMLGLIAGAIAYSRTQSNAAFVVFFIFGAILPLIGIVFACLVKTPPQPAGWRPDPWRSAALRWHDGREWTHHTS